LIDTYIEADAPRPISAFDNMTLVQLIVETGIADAIAQKLNQTGSKEGIAETIDNNIRSTIIKEHIADPAFQEKMSQLLDEVIKLRKSQAISYEEYLKQVESLAKTIQSGTIKTTSSPHINTAGKKALYNALDENEELVLKIHHKVLEAKPAAWKNNRLKQNKLKNALLDALNNDSALMTKVYDVIYAQDEYQ
ncbi:MAG TPA: restriction endonuclease subunit R, partial [Agitococcus sp.]|nr:restriction endonuclease subunit R [Agitococcus sp.]